MNRILMQLEVLKEVPTEVLTLGFMALALVPLVVPRRYHLGTALAFMAMWLNMNRFIRLGAIASVAKVTFELPILLVIVAALLHPGPKRKVSPWFYLYLVLPFIGAACVATTTDRMLGLVYQFNFFLMALTAFFVLRTVVDYAAFRYVIRSLGIGLLVPFVIATYAMVLGGHYRPGLGRFEPFGILSNQFIPILVQFMAICLFCFHDVKNLPVRAGAIALFGAAGAQLILTGSRQGLVVGMLVSLPWATTMLRRPIYALLFVTISAASFVYVFGFSPEKTGIARLKELDDSGRYQIALIYLDEIAKRPVVGLLGTRNHSCISASEAGTHPHNAYVEAFYIGGFVYGGPLMLMVALTMVSMLYVFLHRREVALENSQIILLCALMVGIYAHGVPNNMIFTSVSSWSFINILLSGFFLNLRKDLLEKHSTVSHYAIPSIDRVQ